MYFLRVFNRLVERVCLRPPFPVLWLILTVWIWRTGKSSSLLKFFNSAWPAMQHAWLQYVNKISCNQPGTFGLGSAGISSLSKILGYLEKGFERYIRNCLDLFPQIKLNISSWRSLHHEENFPKFCSIFRYQCLFTLYLCFKVFPYAGIYKQSMGLGTD